MLLNGKTAIITGASSGIGRSIAIMFAQNGASVCLTGRRKAELSEVANEINATGGTAIYYAGDICLEETHFNLINLVSKEFGRLDIAVNNAGMVGPMKPVAEFSLEEWVQVQTINSTAAFLGAKNQIPLMVKSGGGSIIFTSSFVGNSISLPGMCSYGTAKSSLLALAKGIAVDYSDKNIRANVILPGGVNTDMAGNQQQREWAANLHAMKRLAEPEEIASSALFLACSLSSFITGTSLYVDGGVSVCK
ncbi:SDR family oxidoreductase [Providencia rettgeri]|uniref:SDR family oxidoreductase n=2 Tax=Providencia TaxID=586 RepID=A0AA42K3H4_9GAMM|nr:MULTISPECIES: SDR family oxidoreductase [Providencia]MBC8653040.1 SDR family oxidoreductase [Providencia vermicola]HCI97999.1 KR domain-containing protein [Providencia sp.]APC12728.1 Glucose 1-dehydrogenase [Providencia rettgeri]AVL72258.1 KR domain-containing protein [Providencia rettgeri]EIL1984068.1 SDR family oxidoreductase [Providencia rettgeri]